MLEVRDLLIRRSGKVVLDLAQLCVRPGQLLALVGPNGAGKTTLMTALAQTPPRGQGEITLHGRPCSRWRPRELARVRAYLSQQFSLAAALRVSDVVALGRSPHVTPRSVNNAIVNQCLELVGMAWASDRSYLALSGGEQQRVHMARVLAQTGPDPDSWGEHPPLLLLDEPTSSLDLGKRASVLAVAKSIARAGGMVVVVLHDINLAARYADEVCLLDHGRLQIKGPPDDVFTSERLSRTYQADLAVVTDPINGGILVIEHP
ncbi:MAG: heme ABC transporter ATP-binding protein [Ectothiorhodospiraceae bacterium]|nr:heme ABC transporter ATP-binding protein [Ectothiorhodospiraceae bacterium]